LGENALRMGQRNGDGCPGWRNLLRVCNTKGSTEKKGEVGTPVSRTPTLTNTVCNDDPTKQLLRLLSMMDQCYKLWDNELRSLVK